jgi:diacylglycerol kinase
MYVLYNYCGLQAVLSTLIMRRQFLRLFNRQCKFQHNYCIMDMLMDAFIVVGLTSVAFLWIISIMGALQVLWETFGDHLESLVDIIKEKIRR